MQNAIYGFRSELEANEYMEKNGIEGEVKETCQGLWKIVKNK